MNRGKGKGKQSAKNEFKAKDFERPGLSSDEIEEIKELSEFYKKSNKDGYRSKCKDCIKFQSKAWKIKNHDKVLQWRNDNKEYSKTKLKEWRIKNYVYSERVLLSESEKKIRRKEYDKKYLEKVISNLVDKLS